MNFLKIVPSRPQFQQNLSVKCRKPDFYILRIFAHFCGYLRTFCGYLRTFFVCFCQDLPQTDRFDGKPQSPWGSATQLASSLPNWHKTVSQLPRTTILLFLMYLKQVTRSASGQKSPSPKFSYMKWLQTICTKCCYLNLCRNTNKKHIFAACCKNFITGIESWTFCSICIFSDKPLRKYIKLGQNANSAKKI